jgi:transcriptional regulator with XRE-family HTH domain
MSQCACGVQNWREIRAALGLSQARMAAVLGMTELGVWKIERRPHRCPRRQTVTLLRQYLFLALSRSLLTAAGIPHPFPDDLAYFDPDAPAPAIPFDIFPSHTEAAAR